MEPTSMNCKPQLPRYSTIFACFIIFLQTTLAAPGDDGNVMQISFLDGNDEAAQCRAKLERQVHAMSGLVYSHFPFNKPYPSKKNCFITLVAPAGYRIRVQALEFNVNDAPRCSEDSLHMFDHDEVIGQGVDGEMQNIIGPGPILGQFCGRIKNGTELVMSNNNALTLWWHTRDQLPIDHTAKGFRLLWSAFRNGSKSGVCSQRREFACQSSDCIPTELACDQWANCADGSDLDISLQTQHGCNNVRDSSVLDSLSSASLLAICIAAVVGSVVCCVVISICCRHFGGRSPLKLPPSDQQRNDQFGCKQINGECNCSASTLQQQHNHQHHQHQQQQQQQQQNRPSSPPKRPPIQPSCGHQCVPMLHDYTNTTQMDAGSDYASAYNVNKNDQRTTLLNL